MNLEAKDETQSQKEGADVEMTITFAASYSMHPTKHLSRCFAPDNQQFFDKDPDLKKASGERHRVHG